MNQNGGWPSYLGPKKQRKPVSPHTAFLTAWAVALIFCLTIWAGVIYTAVHFARKWW